MSKKRLLPNDRSKWNLSKGIVVTLLIAIAAISLAGCTASAQQEETGGPNAVKSVRALRISEEQYDVELEYQGFMKPKETKAVSFGSSGKVETVYVKQGQEVHKGDILAQMDTSSIHIAITAQQNTIQKTMDSYDARIGSLKRDQIRQEDVCEKTAALYEAGAVSKQEYDDALYALENMKIELQTQQKARSNDIALQKSSMESYQKQLKDGVLKAPMDGYVADVLLTGGEMASFGVPVVTLQTKEQVVSIGVSESDYEALQIGTKVRLEVSGEILSGTVSKIAIAPEESSHSYNVEIIPEENQFPVGTLVKVLIPVESKVGRFVPISAIVSLDGVNYVYALEESDLAGYYTAVKKEVEVEVENSYGEKVRLNNLEPGTLIVQEGVKNIKENDTISVVES